MINIKEVSAKVEQILNDTDNPLRIDNKRVLFLVATQGYRIDSIYNRQEGKNVIPVFIALNGGENTPIPNLNQTSKAIQVAIYYPIKYKDLFYDLESYLNTQIVGKMINFGTLSGVCLTNMGVAEYGEISQMNLQQFVEWADNTYERTFDITSNWFSMSFMLYATSLGTGFLFGNDVSYKLTMHYHDFDLTLNAWNNGTLYHLSRYQTGDIEGLYAWKDGNTILYTKTTDEIKLLTGQVQKIYYQNETEAGTIESVDQTRKQDDELTLLTETLVWTNSGTGSSISPIAQQLIGKDSYAKNVPNITNYNKSFIAYIKPTTQFGAMFLALYNRQRFDLVEKFELEKSYSNGFKFVYNQIALSINENVSLGDPLSFTITLGDKK